jgi:glycosyltransferase involved in cell wall biosynthesis
LTSTERLYCSEQKDTAIAAAHALGKDEAASTEREMPRVTVLIVTYNHEEYIGSAVESVLSQQTKFPFEVLIGEDASTDGTRSIVMRYAEQFPTRIRLLLSDRNIRSNEVVARGLRAARGRYVALLDGDDYWIDIGKLQRQADFLDANPDCTAVFDNARTSVGDRLSDERWTRPDTAARLGLAAIMEGNPFATCTSMMRADCVRDVPDWYADFFPITDWPLYVLCAARGELAFFDDVSGVYRLHAGGEYSNQTASAKHDATEQFYHRLASVAGPPVDQAARDGCSRHFFDWAKAHLDANELSLARACFRRSLRGGGIGRTVPRRAAVRLCLRLLRRSIGGR